jgi:hypothetical protein
MNLTLIATGLDNMTDGKEHLGAFEENPHDYHKFINIELRGEITPIDINIVDIVKILNSWSGLYTVSSCEGRPSDIRWSEWTAHVGICSDDNNWRTLAEFGFETLKPLQESGVTASVVKISLNSTILWLDFPHECIKEVENTLRNLAVTSNRQRTWE